MSDTNNNPAALLPLSKVTLSPLFSLGETLDCVLSVLEQETEEALPRTSHLSSAEFVLRRAIAALYELGGDVENQTLLIEKMREAVQ